jgi:hypothetical protein
MNPVVTLALRSPIALRSQFRTGQELQPVRR